MSTRWTAIERLHVTSQGVALHFRVAKEWRFYRLKLLFGGRIKFSQSGLPLTARLNLHHVTYQASVSPPLCSFFVSDRYTMFHPLPQLDFAGKKLLCAPFSQEFGQTKFFAVHFFLIMDYG